MAAHSPAGADLNVAPDQPPSGWPTWLRDIARSVNLLTAANVALQTRVVGVENGGTGATSFELPPITGGSGANVVLLGSGTLPVTASPWYTIPEYPAGLNAYQSTSEPFASYIEMGLSGGTLTAPAATPNDAVLGALYFDGHDGTDWRYGTVSIEAYTTNAWTPAAKGSGLAITTRSAADVGNVFWFSEDGDLIISGATAAVVAPVSTYALRPTAPALGKEAVFTDATVNTWGTSVTVGGGAMVVRVWWNGANWTVTGR